MQQCGPNNVPGCWIKILTKANMLNQPMSNDFWTNMLASFQQALTFSQTFPCVQTRMHDDETAMVQVLIGMFTNSITSAFPFAVQQSHTILT